MAKLKVCIPRNPNPPSLSGFVSVAALDEPAHETAQPVPEQTGDTHTNKGAGQSAEEEPAVANQAAKLSAPRKKSPGREEERLPTPMNLVQAEFAAAGGADDLARVEVTEQLQQSTLEGPAVGASTAETSQLTLSGARSLVPQQNYSRILCCTQRRCPVCWSLVDDLSSIPRYVS
jgi:hypothetical protein